MEHSERTRTNPNQFDGVENVLNMPAETHRRAAQYASLVQTGRDGQPERAKQILSVKVKWPTRHTVPYPYPAKNGTRAYPGWKLILFGTQLIAPHNPAHQFRSRELVAGTNVVEIGNRHSKNDKHKWYRMLKTSVLVKMSPVGVPRCFARNSN